MQAYRYPRARHDTSHGATVARRSVTCALAALLTLAAPAAGGVGIALARPAVPVTDDTEVLLVSQNAPDFWPSKKTKLNTRKKVLIDEQKALSIALRDLNLKAENVHEIEAELEGDETAPVYEVELHIGNIEHEYEIDAYSGAIVSHTKEWEGDFPRRIIIRRKD